jgi:predicted neuraminidase/peroxiredoxin
MNGLRLFVLTSCLIWSSGLTAQSSLTLGEAAGPVTLVTPQGLQISMNNYSERLGTVVLFLSSRDEGTIAEASEIEKLNQDYRRHKILFVGVYPAADENGSEVRAFSQAHGFNFPVYQDPNGAAATRFGVRVTPEAFLLNKEGKLVYFGSIEDLSSALTAMVSGESFPASTSELSGTPIGKSLPERTIVDPFGEIDFSSELIFDKIPGYPVVHCSSITIAPNGDLLVSWYGGSYESADDQVLFLSRRKKGSRVWSRPEIIVRSPGRPPGNAVLFTTPDNRVWMVWGRMDGAQPQLRGSGWSDCTLFYRTSSDSGMTWTEDKPFFHDTLGWLPRNLTIFLSDGTLILPLSDERNGHGVDLSFFLSTKDNGATWTRSAIMRGGEQPTFVQRGDGSLLAYLRVRPNIVSAESYDGGKTWTTPTPTQWKNPDSGISMRRLKDGHLVLVFNNEDDARTPLNIVMSVDDGRTWGKPLALESNPGEYSYPSIFQATDGKIHIIYTFRRYSIKHVEMNEDWLTHLQRPD